MRPSLCILLALLSACAIRPTETPPDFQPDPARARQLIQVAETALQQDRREEAARAYAQAAVHARWPRIAERATRLCYEQGLDELAEQSARRWLVTEPDDTRPRRYLTSLALARGDTDAAVDQMERLLAGTTTDFSMRFEELADWLAGESDSDRALEAFQQLIRRQGDADPARLALAKLALGSDRPAIAVEQARQVHRRDPGNVEAALHLAEGLRRQGRSGEAVVILEQALDAAPEDLGLLRLLGDIQLEATDPARTEATYRRILELDAGAADARFLAAAMALEQGELGRAEDDLKQLLQDPRFSPDAAFLLGRIFLQRDDPRRAAAAFRAARRGRFGFQATLAEARALASIGQAEEARTRLEEVRPEDGERGETLSLTRAFVEVEAGEPAAAIPYYDRILAEQPEHTDALYGRGLAYAVMGDVERAEADLRRLLDRDPDDADVLNALGYTLADLTERLDEAERLVRQALERRPEEPAFLDSMGWILFRQGEPDAAVEFLQRAWLGQRDPEIAAHLGEVLWNVGQRTRARSIWGVAERLFPADPVLEETLERIQP